VGRGRVLGDGERWREHAAQGSGQALLLDTTTGRVWFLQRAADGQEVAWIPCRAFNDLKDAQKWQKFQDLKRKQMQKGAGGRPRPLNPYSPH
jgi:hypothetical protein